MSAQPISNEVALRVALAAKKFPDLSIADFLGILQDLTNDNITEETLGKVTVTQLKTGMGQTYQLEGEEDGEDASAAEILALKEAVRILWGETGADKLPQIETYEEGEPHGEIRIAVASNSGENLDGHFGSCLRFLIYDLSTDKLKLVDIRSALEADLSDDKNGFRVNLIRDCKMLYIVAIGGPAAAKVVQAGIYPLKKEEGGSAREKLLELQQALRTSPPPWMAKILGVSQLERVKNYKALV